ncbi:hypothetical protein PDIG_36220 [Penicillium digitatum PHI26]|uniref:Protein kinase domain-containing protein n=2 Tax=Penicillium digitatum TaxID=36651 RepID=K9GKF8_PEND2|nr:hypothetical protein PDIP_05260 [Penicillium digitatum Pd1]EKV13711.1 hypothetical protein PDIG_36220 [Penicillium digitatum PHI26]EKV21563.1 hypothetical protein PDIP_05260 [Penicillium digitatum Pd1]
MDIQRQYPSVHWIWGGGISFVYEVHPRIVVKVPKSGEFERQQFHKELEIYQVFSQNPPCHSIVQCFLFSDSGIFLEYMREWMNDLAQAVAFLESLNLAHGDLRPENVLLDRNRLKLSDFDCTARIGTNYEACMAPYGRILNHRESDQGECGTFGFLGPRTEQFALGSLYYLINYGFEIYGDRCLAEDPYEHGPKVVDLLQNMEFPNLDGNPLIDNIIIRCWHNKYVKISDLAAHTKTLLNERTVAMESSGSGKKESREVANLVKTMLNERWYMVIGRLFHGIFYGLGTWWRSLLQSVRGESRIAKRVCGDHNDVVDQNCLEKDFLSKKEFCQDLEKRGLLEALTLGEPEEIGFTFDWYRYSTVSQS